MARNNPKPTEKPDWVPDDSTNIVTPSPGRKTSGWTYLIKPPAQNLNWLWNLLSRFTDYFSAQVEDWIVIDSDADEGDYATLAAYLADAPAAGDRILIKEDQTVTAQTIIPLNITLKFLDGAQLLCATNIATSILQLGSNIIIEGTLEIVLSHTGTTAKAVELNGDNVTGKINVENSSTGTLTTAYHINANKTGNDVKGFLRNTGGGAVTNTWVDNSTELSNLLVIFNELDNTVRTNGAGLVDLYNPQSIEGEKTFINQLRITNTLPSFRIKETDGSLDNKVWDLQASGESLRLRVVNDAEDTATNVFTVSRIATVVDLLNILSTNLQHNGVKVPTVSSTDTLTNKTLGTGSKIALGSDADGDIYYRNAGILKRLAKGTNGDILSLASGIPDWLTRGAFSAHKNGTNQTGVVTSTWTKVTFSTEEYDTNTEFASSTYTPKVAGKHDLKAAIQWTNMTNDSDIIIAVYKNGAEYKQIRNIIGGTITEIPSIPISIDVDANGSTDYFEIYVWHNKGADAIISGDSKHTWFMGSKK